MGLLLRVAGTTGSDVGHGGNGGWSARQQGERLTGELPFEATQDLRRGLALRRAARGVGTCARIPCQPAHGEQVERAVGVAVPAPVEPVAHRLAGGRRDRRDPAQVREGRFAAR